VLGGDQVSIPVSVLVNVCGNAAAVLGDSAAGCEGTATVHQAGASAALPGGALPGSPKAVPMRRLSAIRPAADSLIPGLAALPVMSALEGLPSQAASMGRAWQPSLPGGAYPPWASHAPRTGRLPLGTWREAAGRKPGARGKKTVSRWPGDRAVPRSAARQAASRGFAILGALPVVTGTPGLASGPAPAALSALTTGSTAVGKAMPASTLTAGSGPGMGTASFYSLAIGALMAGAVALKMAGRRIRAVRRNR
jgi:hypothetical protein